VTLPSLPNFSFTAVIDILLAAFIIYQLFMLVRGRRAAQLLLGVGVFIAVYLLSMRLRLELLRSILAVIVPYTAFALILLFQTEIRRALIRVGRRGFGFGGRLQRLEYADEILLAVSKLAQQKTGALIVLERETGLRTFTESGVRLDAQLSHYLLLTIFQEGSALHDGAVIVQKDRVVSASCFLPLSMNPGLSRKLGTRHRAAIGITEDTDALSVVVSEETGRISVAASGELEQGVTLRRLDDRLAQHFGRRGSSPFLSEDTAGDIPLNSVEPDWRSER